MVSESILEHATKSKALTKEGRKNKLKSDTYFDRAALLRHWQKIFVASYEGLALGCGWPSSSFPACVVDSVFVNVFAVHAR